MFVSRWFARLFAFLYIALVLFCIVGIFVSGIREITVNTFFFVLLGLFGLPILLNLLPAVEKFNLFGVELQFKEKVENTEKRIRDLADTFDDRIKGTVLTFVSEQSLTEEGKKEFRKFKEKENER